MYLIIDQEALLNQPTSKFLTQEEYKTPQRKLNFIFKHGKTQEVEELIAYALVQKYPSIKIVDKELKVLSIEDDLDSLRLNEVRHLCREYGIPAFQMGMQEMKMLIRKKRYAGIEPKRETLKEVHESKKKKLANWVAEK